MTSEPVSKNFFTDKEIETGTIISIDHCYHVGPARPFIKVDKYNDVNKIFKNLPEFSVSISDELFHTLNQYEQRIHTSEVGNDEKIHSSNYEGIIDWIVCVHDTFEMVPETLFLSVALFNRYVHICKIQSPSTYWRAAEACLFIAIKYEEVGSKILSMSTNPWPFNYSRKEIIETELEILRVLEFDINLPTSYTYLTRYLVALSEFNIINVKISIYILSRVLQVSSFSHYLPSKVAASAVYIMREKQHNNPTWSDTLIHYTQYTDEDIKGCVADIKRILALQTEYKRIYDIYQKNDKHNVSSLFGAL